MDEYLIVRIAQIAYSHEFRDRSVLIGRLSVCPDGSLAFSDGTLIYSNKQHLGSSASVAVSLLHNGGGFVSVSSYADADVLLRGVWPSMLPKSENKLTIAVSTSDILFLAADSPLHSLALFYVDARTLDQLFQHQQRVFYQSSVATLHKYPAPVHLASVVNFRNSNPYALDIFALRKSKRVNLFGIVQSKSALMDIHNSRFFLINFLCGDSTRFSGLAHQGIRLVSTFIMFEQRLESIPGSRFEDKKAISPPPHRQIKFLFNQICVNGAFMFSNMPTKQIKFSSRLPNPLDPKSNIVKLLAFDTIDSELHFLDPKALEFFVDQQRRSIPSTFLLKSQIQSQPFITDQASSKSIIMSYTGRITEIVNVDVGKYQLDGKHDLFLAHHPSLDPAIELLLFPGTVLTLHNVHLILYETVDVPGLFKEVIDRGPLPSRNSDEDIKTEYAEASTEKVEENRCQNTFSLLHDPAKRAKIKAKWTSLNMMDLILLDDIFATICAFQSQRSRRDDNGGGNGCSGAEVSNAAVFNMAKEILKRATGFCEWPADASTPRLGLVLRHDTECTVATLRYVQPFLVSVDMAVFADGSIVVEFIERYTNSIASTNAYQRTAIGREDAVCRIFSMDELGVTDCFLLGTIDVGCNGGALNFVDSSGSAPIMICFVQSESSTSGKNDRSMPLNVRDLHCCVVVLRFDVVVEVLGVSQTNSWDGKTVPVVKTYLRCSTNDCLFESRFDTSFSAVYDTWKAEVPSQINQDNRTIVMRVESKSAGTLDLKSNGELGIKSKLLGTVWTILQEENSDGTLRCSEQSFQNAICEIFGEIHSNFVNVGDWYLMTQSSKVTPIQAQAPAANASTALVNGRVLKLVGGQILILSIEPPLLSPAIMQIYTISSILASVESIKIAPGSFHSTLVNISGRIVSKSFTIAANTYHLHDRIPALDLFTMMNIGTGRYDQVMVLKITDVDKNSSSYIESGEMRTMQVYIDSRSTVFQLGVIPGSVVELNRIALKMANSNGNNGKRSFYGQGISETSIRVLDHRDDGNGVKNTVGTAARWDSRFHSDTIHTLPRINLVHLYSTPPEHCASRFAFSGIIVHVEEVCLWCECGKCGIKLVSVDAAVLCRCGSSNYRSGLTTAIQGKAKIHVDDGTSEACVLFESAEAIFGLLGFGDGGIERRRLEEAVLSVAGADVVYFQNPPWFLLDDVSKDAAVAGEQRRENGQIYTYGDGLLENGSNGTEILDFDMERLKEMDMYSQLEIEDLGTRKLKLAEAAPVEILAPPRIVLHGFHIERLNVLMEASRLLRNM
ncbi:hypothetical protein HK100_002802 [Physocladia obscura]|uniref:CST complex subunit CTC1 n=1 Tax=Physocladia obscura TaxID=109957 RepID=A0AAD5XF58_9FUNG|nr:hypothetical protein HK100_002802 [Physocladia obscura]